ncbi:Uncharacterised protein [Mycobacterium tuberculosis]|uniref:Uncharacterized protein n=1 Tax=Mycobacterium tuberculosis TaxID=1773 RepID=A0A655AP09_MYCTX|nr:Uncharacterised protein [Mycobacterium tuberculosis]CKT86137.1 Uncharacterised protein [Mycobacterium tuberculosis]
MHARIHREAAEVDDQRPQRRQPGATGDHEHVAAVAVHPKGSVRTGQSPPVTGPSFTHDGVADQATGNHPDVKLDPPVRVGRNGWAEISPPAGALRNMHVDVLARVIVQRAVQLQPSDSKVA